MSFAEYLNQPCDSDGCDRRATHNQSLDGARGKFCNAHTNFEMPCRARND